MVCSKFWRLDKFDKIVISLIFIVLSMFSIFNCFSFASISLELSYLSDSWVRFTGENFNIIKIVDSPGNKLAYIRLSKGVTYNFRTVPGSSFSYVFAVAESPSINAGSQLKYVRDLNTSTNNNFDYTVTSDNEYMVIYASTPNVNYDYVDISVVSTSMASSLNLLINNVGFSQLWSVFEFSLPWVLVVVLFVFGWWFFAHWIKELGKGREF